MRGQILAIVRKFINSDFPGIFRYLTGYIAILIGTGITMTIQSSSVFTSALTPLVGIGILSMERMYPLTLGANLGTTFVAIIIALSQNADDMPIAFHVALCHVFFNISGVLLYYPIPMTRLPIRMAKFLGNKTARYRWYSVAYLLVLFVILPAVVFGLSSISRIALVVVSVPLIIILLCIAVINILQTKRPDVLPVKLKTWKFLPSWCRSLEPYDKVIKQMCCKCCKQK
jgi:sodium-dependent phosphate cotransporter